MSYHTTKSGKVIKISDMSTEHIKNTISLINKELSFLNTKFIDCQIDSTTNRTKPYIQELLIRSSKQYETNN